MTLLTTPRLVIREMELSDADFIYRLYNQPLFKKYVGDKKITDVAAATDYIVNGPQKSYESFGFGLLLVCLKDGTPIGACGLLQRDNLPVPDLGYAIDESHYQKGYTYEACKAVLEQYQDFSRLMAIVSFANQASIKLLNKLGFSIIDENHKDFPDTYLLSYTRV